MLKFILLGCLFLTACATPYQDGRFSITGGYFEQPVNSHLTKVAFYANGFTSVTMAVRFAKFRCAEIADKNKKPYFLMYPSLDSAANRRSSLFPAEGSIGGKPAAIAFLALSDEKVPGAIETSAVMTELEAMRASYHEAQSAHASQKSSNRKQVE